MRSCQQKEVNILQCTEIFVYNGSLRLYNRRASNITKRYSDCFYICRIKIPGAVFWTVNFRWEFYISLKLNVVSWSIHALILTFHSLYTQFDLRGISASSICI